jgi:hypothetical protein
MQADPVVVLSARHARRRGPRRRITDGAMHPIASEQVPKRAW